MRIGNFDIDEKWIFCCLGLAVGFLICFFIMFIAAMGSGGSYYY